MRRDGKSISVVRSEGVESSGAVCCGGMHGMWGMVWWCYANAMLCMVLYTVLTTGEIIKGSIKTIFWSQIGSALCNQTKIGNPCALDDFESECIWISDFWYDVSFSLYEGSKLLKLILQSETNYWVKSYGPPNVNWSNWWLRVPMILLFLWSETHPIIGTVYSTYLL